MLGNENSTAAVDIILLQPDLAGTKEIASFKPIFTYPIFGEDESVFGYQDLSIKLQFASHDLMPNVEITYAAKFETQGKVEADDIKALFDDRLPDCRLNSLFIVGNSLISNVAAWNATSHFKSNLHSEAATDYKPPGTLLKTYESRGKTFEIWKASILDPDAQELLLRMQILIPLFIEGGLPINLDDPEWSLKRWTLHFLYVSQPSWLTNTDYLSLQL
jgi:histone acetyltransferase 1